MTVVFCPRSTGVRIEAIEGLRFLACCRYWADQRRKRNLSIPSIPVCLYLQWTRRKWPLMDYRWDSALCTITQWTYLKVCANVQWATSGKATWNQWCVFSFKNINNGEKQNSHVLAKKNNNFSHFQKFAPVKWAPSSRINVESSMCILHCEGSFKTL